jgi:hypothetical protein
MENSNYIKNRDKKDSQDVKRYELIVKYFNKNKDRINANRDSLTYLYDSISGSQLGLTNTFFFASDLSDRVASVLSDLANLINEGKSI